MTNLLDIIAPYAPLIAGAMLLLCILVGILIGGRMSRLFNSEIREISRAASLYKRRADSASNQLVALNAQHKKELSQRNAQIADLEAALNAQTVAPEEKEPEPPAPADADAISPKKPETDPARSEIFVQKTKIERLTKRLDAARKSLSEKDKEIAELKKQPSDDLAEELKNARREIEMLQAKLAIRDARENAQANGEDEPLQLNAEDHKPPADSADDKEARIRQLEEKLRKAEARSLSSITSISKRTGSGSGGSG